MRAEHNMLIMNLLFLVLMLAVLSVLVYLLVRLIRALEQNNCAKKQRPGAGKAE